MPRRFNTAGPNKPEIHYTLPALRRLPQVRELIDEQSYFVLHSPRQMGKTTSLLGLSEELTREGRFAAVLLSMEVGSSFSDQPSIAEPAILDSWRQSAEAWLPKDLLPPPWPEAPIGQRIGAALSSWAKACPRQIIEPMLLGDNFADVSEDDRQYAIDLGLLCRNPQGGLVVSNPIYQKMIPRALASGPRDSLARIEPSWLKSDGSLDFEKLLESFLSFWRQHGEPLLRTAPYHEVAPHLWPQIID